MKSESLTLIKRRFHFHVGMHVMCPWSFASLTSFNCFFKPIRIFWSNFYQLHVLMLTLPTHDIMILGGMNGKLASENFFWKWISRERRKWWNDCSKLALIAIEFEQIVNMLTISMKNAIVSNLTIVAFQFFVMNSFTSYV